MTAPVAVALPGRLPIVLVALLFAVLHGYTLLLAISNLVALPGVYELFGIGDAVPWWLLVLSVIAPVVLFATAMLLGRGRSLAQRVLLLAVSLGATNAIALSIAALVAAFQPAFG
ncbi:MAG: hypothetical protein ABIQ01_08130 [Pseudolysinimonas sp.]